MSDPTQGPSRGGSTLPGPDREPESDSRSVAVVGPFTARDLAVFGGVLVMLIGSVLPLVQRGTQLNLWNAQNLYFIAIGILLPIILAGLFVWRRLAPSASIRVGSLSLDQFGSVVAAFACSYFFVFAVTALTPGGFVGFIGGAILVAATVLGRFIPGFAKDFVGRAEVPAHVVARDAVAPIVKPKAPRPQKAPVPGPQQQGSPVAPAPWAGTVTHDGGPAPAASAPPSAGRFSPRPSAGAETAVSPTVASPTVGAGAGTPGAGAASAGVAGAAVAAAAAASAERDAQTRALRSAPTGQPGDDAVVLGDADGEAYGAPGAVEVAAAPAPTATAPAEPAPTATAPAEPVAAPESPAPAAPTPEVPAPEVRAPEVRAPEPAREPARAPEPENEVGPATQVAPAVDPYEGFEATRSFEEPEPEYEAFWFAVNQQRMAFDPESGLPVFALEPGQWILALQDRGNEFLVQSQDGRIGILRDLSGIERG
ncbi:hypothetical protein [Sinomonas sp.]|uniref:hypothetical protein n=1 Tax=Sinomonas sp. TaxID=1914986 RepID=UPI003F811F24